MKRLLAFMVGAALAATSVWAASLNEKDKALLDETNVAKKQTSDILELFNTGSAPKKTTKSGLDLGPSNEDKKFVGFEDEFPYESDAEKRMSVESKLAGTSDSELVAKVISKLAGTAWMSEDKAYILAFPYDYANVSYEKREADYNKNESGIHSETYYRNSDTYKYLDENAPLCYYLSKVNPNVGVELLAKDVEGPAWHVRREVYEQLADSSDKGMLVNVDLKFIYNGKEHTFSVPVYNSWKVGAVVAKTIPCEKCGTQLPLTTKNGKGNVISVLYCFNCGHKQQVQEDRYCWKCGNKLTAAEIASGFCHNVRMTEQNTGAVGTVAVDEGGAARDDNEASSAGGRGDKVLMCNARIDDAVVATPTEVKLLIGAPKSSPCDAKEYQLQDVTSSAFTKTPSQKANEDNNKKTGLSDVIQAGANAANNAGLISGDTNDSIQGGVDRNREQIDAAGDAIQNQVQQ